MTNKLKKLTVGDTITVNTAEHVYEGEVINVTSKRLLMVYFNGVKDELREVEIPLNEIQSIEMDY